MASLKGKIITVVGSGLIGRSWAMVFLSGGYKVKIYDNEPGQASGAITEIRKQLEELQQAKMLRGNLTAAQQLSLLSSHDDLLQALEGAFFVQNHCLSSKRVIQCELPNELLFLLIQDGVISVKDIDLVMSEGLGMRYAFIGPIETMHLNAPE
ncbi:lambda-crystallin-like, partial [Sinocyclocheilus grahami]|uniref:lambda-crystallin-like n=1 Tax=Sinocyclocheilus grahami TaxID=75366 RepID=UPI0007ACEF1B